jgi:archaellum biogenesis ATPase FlaH
MGTIAKGYEADDRRALDRNLKVMPSGTPLPLDTPEGQAFLGNVLDEHQPDVLIIDSMQKILSKEMSDESAVKSLVHYLSTLRAKYKCAIVVIHHYRKKPNEHQKKIVDLSDVYGSTYLTTDVEFVLSLNKEELNVLSVDMLKNRLGPETAPFQIVRNENLGFSTEFGDIIKGFTNEPANPGLRLS